MTGKSGNFRGSLGNFRGGLGNFRGTSGLLLTSTVRELPGKSPKKFRGSRRKSSGEVAEKVPGKFGEFPGKSGDFPKARGSLTPSQRLAKYVSNFSFVLNLVVVVYALFFSELVIMHGVHGCTQAPPALRGGTSHYGPQPRCLEQHRRVA